jgi:hypothetical protein
LIKNDLLDRHIWKTNLNKSVWDHQNNTLT